MKTNLITPGGYSVLKTELDYLWRKKRPEISKIVAWAASLGDRSDNADYQFNKSLLRQIDGRVRFLRKRLECLKVVEYSPQQEGKVFFGAKVTIENEEGQQKAFQIVGPDEIFEDSDHISIDAPMARALLGKSINDEAVVKTPTGEKHWFVVSIFYPGAADFKPQN